MQKGKSFSRLMHHKAIPLLVILIVFVIITMLISSGVLEGRPLSALFTRGFLSSGNLINIFNKLVIQSFMICGIVLILIGGNIDLSVAGQAGLSAMIFAWLIKNTSLSWVVILVMCIVIASAFGLINTFLVNRLKFPAFIATIGMSSVYAGLCNIMTKGNNIQIAPKGNEAFLALGRANIGGWLPVLFLIAAIVMMIYQFILSRTTFGRSIFMCGGNPNAARLSGLKPDKMRMFLFVNNSILAAIGGILWTAQIKLASPTAIVTSGFDFRVISAAILGGVAFFGGGGSIGGAFVALLLLNVFENMLTVLGVQEYWIVFASGVVLVIALLIDYMNAERQRKALLIAATSGK
jgi:ribose/xylose/arabinose/galactoside ABC-type transport system permease subunit